MTSNMQLQQLDEEKTHLKSEFFTQTELRACCKNSVPSHVAFIPDGNRRWAKKNQMTISQGHRAGADNLIKMVKASKELGIRTVTFYTLSTENWSRDALELRAFLWLLESYLSDECANMIENGIRFQTIGDLSRFPSSVYKTIQATKEATADCEEVDMVLALNYGGRDEMRRTIQAIIKDYEDKKFETHEITEELISGYLDTATWPDPDLVIRTSGEQRLSNFLLWQASYSEIYIENAFWPDFTPQHLFHAVMEFQKRERRLGRV